MSLHHRQGYCLKKEQETLGEFPLAQLRVGRTYWASIYGAGHSTFQVLTSQASAATSQAFGGCWHNDSLQAGAAWATVLPTQWRVDRVQPCCPQTPEFRIFLRLALFLSSVESWKLPNSLLGLASCPHVFWSHVIVHEVIVPHACIVTMARFVWFSASFLTRTFWTFHQLLREGRLELVIYYLTRTREQGQHALLQQD